MVLPGVVTAEVVACPTLELPPLVEEAGPEPDDEDLDSLLEEEATEEAAEEEAAEEDEAPAVVEAAEDEVFEAEEVEAAEVLETEEDEELLDSPLMTLMLWYEPDLSVYWYSLMLSEGALSPPA